MSMIVYVLGIFLIAVILAIVIPVVLVVKRKKDWNKTNMNLYQDEDISNR